MVAIEQLISLEKAALDKTEIDAPETICLDALICPAAVIEPLEESDEPVSTSPPVDREFRTLLPMTERVPLRV
jgi:hypothetical protein